MTHLFYRFSFPKFFGDHGSKDCIFVDFNIKEDSAYVVDDCRNKRSFICKKENGKKKIILKTPLQVFVNYSHKKYLSFGFFE